MSSRAPVLLAVLLVGCAAGHNNKGGARVTELDVATEVGCANPSVAVPSVRRLHGSHDTDVLDPEMPLLLEPGRYAVDVRCRAAYLPESNRCEPFSELDEFPTYKWKLKGGVKYTFHCFRKGGDIYYRLEEAPSNNALDRARGQ